MKKLLLTLLLAVVCLCLAEVSYGELVIKPSPATVVVVVKDEVIVGCNTITVHTNIPFNSAYYVEINDVKAGIFADDLGRLVARACIKVSLAELKAEKMTVTLNVMLNGEFIGEDSEDIAVKEAGPRPQPKTGKP